MFQIQKNCVCHPLPHLPSWHTVKITVYITPKKSVLDPQGAAVALAMQSLGYESATNVRVGKTVAFELDTADTPETRAGIDKLCKDLLSNPVIEDYRYEVS